MLDLEFYLQRREKIKESIKALFIQRADAGPANVGDIENKIKDLTKELDKIETDIEKFTPKSPENVQIFCYVIVSNKETVRNNIGDDCFDCIECDRYHDTNIRYWKPFYSKDVISDILQEFKKTTGYQFNEKYLDGELSDDEWAELDDTKKNSVVIVDLLSLHEKNKQIASRFDTEDVAGVLIPFCVSLIQQPKIYSLMLELRAEVFRSLPGKMKIKGCSIYESNIPEFDSFYQKLLIILGNRFKIVNKIKTESRVRGVDISLQ